jgi:hypothetical protein
MRDIRWTFDAQGGFIVCSARNNWDYAYPTSPHATQAKKDPAHVASIMARKADTNSTTYYFPKRNQRIAEAYQRSKS